MCLNTDSLPWIPVDSSRLSRPVWKTLLLRTHRTSTSKQRLCFIHTELVPANGTAPGADGIPPPQINQTRGRSDSDPNDAPVSLLQRISAKRNQEVATANAESTYPPPSRPRTGSLRVDTSPLDQPSTAYPSFTAKGDLFLGHHCLTCTRSESSLTRLAPQNMARRQWCLFGPPRQRPHLTPSHRHPIRDRSPFDVHPSLLLAWAFPEWQLGEQFLANDIIGRALCCPQLPNLAFGFNLFGCLACP
jgi:hypothetical protein